MSSVGASVHLNHKKRTNTPPSLRLASAAQSKGSHNTFDRPANRTDMQPSQNGRDYGRRKAPLVTEEDGDDFDAINSPSMRRHYSVGAQSPTTERHLPPKGPGSRSAPRIASPNEGALPPPSPASSYRSGRPPLSPSPAGTQAGYSTLPSSSSSHVSAVKDRARNFYPSRSRENLTKSREALNKSREYLNRSRDSLQSSSEAGTRSLDRGGGGSGSQDYLNYPRSRSQGGPTSPLRSFGKDFGSEDHYPRDYAPERDATFLEASHQGYPTRAGRPYDRDQQQPPLLHSSRHQDWESSDHPRRPSDSIVGRSRDMHTYHQHDTAGQRERDRSRSFDFDPPAERSKEKVSSRERSLPRHLSETSHPSYPEPQANSNSSSLPSGPPHTGQTPSPQSTTLSGYPMLQMSSGYGTGSTGMHSPMSHNISISSMKPVGASSHTPSIYSSSSSRHPSQASSIGYQSSLPESAGRPMSFVRAMQVTNDIREKRAAERIRKQGSLSSTSSSRKENTKSVYDTYEASV